MDYGGSSGYGRAYRQQLDGGWGVVDVDDCAAAATFLAERGDVDPERLAIAGGSAGGYTTLAALAFRDTFAAGISRYGIGDLEILAGDTHKFESRYMDGLVGPYPAMADRYRQRSPVHYLDEISCPVLILQGADDQVVPPTQADGHRRGARGQRHPVRLPAVRGRGPRLPGRGEPCAGRRRPSCRSSARSSASSRPTRSTRSSSTASTRGRRDGRAPALATPPLPPDPPVHRPDRPATSRRHARREASSNSSCVLFAFAIALAYVARRIRVAYPILLVLGGLGLGLLLTRLPNAPTIELPPELVFLLFLPPILFGSAFSTPIRDFKANLRAIGQLAIGLVLFTTLVVGLVAGLLVKELQWAPAFALGAIVAPPDAVAATSVLRRLGVPRRVITILEGESLVNDASALILFRVAVAAVLTGSFSALQRERVVRRTWASAASRSAWSWAGSSRPSGAAPATRPSRSSCRSWRRSRPTSRPRRSGSAACWRR